MGATLAKLAWYRPGGAPSFRLMPAGDLSELVRAVEGHAPASLGLTGGGAAALAARLARPGVQVPEFDAWAAGVRALLAAAGGRPSGERYLLVAIGTGTSILLVDGEKVQRLGGTALGGGTILGLGAAILQIRSFEELVRLAAAGARDKVDLLISDVYQGGASPLPGEWTAASFGRLARGGERPPGADLAAAVMGLVGENVGMLTGTIALSAGVSAVVFAGSCLRGNPLLSDLLCRVLLAYGRQPRVLPDGEFGAAFGALLCAADGR